MYRWIRVFGPSVTIEGWKTAIASFTPSVSGVYTFRLIVDDGDVNGRASTEVTVTVSNAAPVANAGEDVEAQKLTRITLSGSAFDGDRDAVAVVWSQVSGPASVTLRNPDTVSSDFVAPAAGVYVFRIQVTDSEGAVSFDETTVTVWGLAPTAVVTATPTTFVGTSIVFDGSGSSDPDGSITEYTLDFGDGTRPSSGTNPTQSHAFHADGVYVISLVVTDDDGNVSARSSVKVTVFRPTNLPPIAKIVVSPTSGPPSTVFTFDASTSSDDGTIVAYAWDFGDRTTSIGVRTTHSYPHLGAFTVTLTVTDDTGLEGTARASVVVWVGPTPPDAMRPGIMIVFPQHRAEFSEGSITVRGTAWDNVGVVAVKVSLDGVTWFPAHGKTEWFARLVLEAGERTISVRAFDAAGNEGYASVTIFVATQGPGGDGPPRDNPMIIEIIIIIGIIIIIALWRGRKVWFPYVIYWLYTKLRKEEVLDNFARGEIYGFIRLNPGESYSDIKRSLHMATGSLTYHLAVLERTGLIRSVPHHAQKLFYSRDANVPETNGDLRALQVRILKALKEDPGIAVSDLAQLLGVSRHVALYHIRKLVRSDLVRLDRKGVRLRAFPLGTSFPPDEARRIPH